MKRIFKNFIIIIIIALCSLYYLFNTLYIIPETFEKEGSFEVYDGESIFNVSIRLEREGYIKSASAFRVLLSLKNKETKISSGFYDFPIGINLLKVADKFAIGKSDRPSILLTVPEGFTNIEIANRLESVTKNKISKELFLEVSKNYQGRLFPETYYLKSNDNAESIVGRMLKEFDKKVGEISNSDLVLASIIEAEAKTEKDMQIVSGILQKRIKIGMALQVDVAMETYKERGVPDYPINNPGVNAIYAVRNPISTEYLYYLTGKDGNMYYAKDFTTHKKNIERYLK